jgi:hypothetical protein
LKQPAAKIMRKIDGDDSTAHKVIPAKSLKGHPLIKNIVGEVNCKVSLRRQLLFRSTNKTLYSGHVWQKNAAGVFRPRKISDKIKVGGGQIR